MGAPEKSRKYRILLVVRWPVGGIRTWLRYIYAQLDPSRYELMIVLPGYDEFPALEEDLKVHNPEYIPLPPGYKPRDFLREVFRVARTRNVDLIHSHGLTSALYSSAAALITNTPHLLTLHDVFTDGQFVGMKGYLKRLVVACVMRAPDRIHCVSHDVYSNLLEYIASMRGHISKLVVIPNGIEIERFQKRERRDLHTELNLPDHSFLLGFFGRFMSQKGFKYLIDALELLMKDPEIKRKPVVIACGNGGYIREERDRVSQKGLSKHVVFLPFTPDVAPIMRGVDVVVMPSLWEACPLVAMEALVAGVPVVGTDCIGLREVLRDTPSTMVRAADSEALAQALREEIIAPSREKAKAFAAEAGLRFDGRPRFRQLESLIAELASRGTMAAAPE